jgi:16S rRNA (guanine1516-N2)-methyltransferase
MILDFTMGKMGYRLKRCRQEPLVKLVFDRVPNNSSPTVLDFTAGLGSDAMLLAQAGCVVTAFEQCAPVAQVLRAGLEAAQHTFLKEACARFTLIEANVLQYVPEHPLVADVVYCDPMFPEKTKTAASRGPLQWLQTHVSPPAFKEEQALLAVAQQAASWVIVKRPRLAPFLAGKKPHHQRVYRSCRFDVYQG